uniref:translational regulator orb2 isoform X2 n=1 Tax=Anopheles coluzzii TaxID=1518534 RepID=UPI0020FFBA9D|nr:translational regulator orb2 isoform X2 [Anopheles coluzzii]
MPKRKKAPSPKFDLLEDGFDDDFSSNANARERARMRVLSKAFFNLKRNIPWVPADTKLSKLDTLRLAKNYITYLAATLDGQSVEDFSTNLAQPPKTAWPFIFQQVQPHETSKSSKHGTQSTTAAAFTATPPNVGQSTCATMAADRQPGKWVDYHHPKDVTSGGVAVSEGIKSQTIAPSPLSVAASLGGFSENRIGSTVPGLGDGVVGVTDYGGFGGEAMGMVGNSATLHHQPQQEPHHTHRQQQQQHSVGQQEHHHQLHHHGHQQYQTAGGSGCHVGGSVGMSGAYQHRQHMASIGSD